MGQEANAIARHIEEERYRLSATVDALEARAQRTLDWRRRFRENARAGLAIAFAVELVAATFFRRNDGFITLEDVSLARVPGAPNPALQAIQTAILGFLAHEVRQFVERHRSLPTDYAADDELRG